jgi:hypothetical protein
VECRPYEEKMEMWIGWGNAWEQEWNTAISLVAIQEILRRATRENGFFGNCLCKYFVSKLQLWKDGKMKRHARININ